MADLLDAMRGLAWLMYARGRCAVLGHQFEWAAEWLVRYQGEERTTQVSWRCERCRKHKAARYPPLGGIHL